MSSLKTSITPLILAPVIPLGVLLLAEVSNVFIAFLMVAMLVTTLGVGTITYYDFKTRYLK